MKEYFLAVFSILVSGISLAQNDCQEIVQLILSTSIEETIETNPTTGEVITYYDICPGETLTLEASAQFPENNTTYFQSISNTSFSWYLDEILESNIQNFTYTFENSGGYIISLYAEDVNGCPTTGPVNVLVRVGGGATINPSVEPSSVCPGLVASIGPGSSSDLLFSTAIEGGSWESTPCEDEFSEPLYLPDGTGAVYNTHITLACFGEGQILTNVNDIISTDINIEHSYMGDLDIYLTAPNGVQVTLFTQENGAGGPIWLGEATHGDDSETNPGIGYDYGWSMNPTYNGTMADGVINNTSISSNGTGYILNSDTYLPVGNFNDFIGTPLNGTWTITVVDYLEIDNGWIFSWGININQDLIPSSWSFNNYIVDEYFLSQPNIISNLDSSITIQTTPGTNTYSYEVVDNFGCTNNEEITITTTPYVTAYFEASQDTVVYTDGMVQFSNLSTPDPQTTLVSSEWDFGDGQFSTEDEPEHNFNYVGTYSVELTVTDEIGCTDVHSSEVVAVEDYFIWIPTAFTPNGDGKNDIYKPILHNVTKSGFELFIYDRWGKVVYQSKDIHSGWNGIRQDNGISAESSSYSFVMRFISHRDIEEKTGLFVLLK